MKEKLKELAGALLGYSVVAVVILAVIVVIAVVSGSIMRLFGFEYESVWGIILFFIIVMIVGFPLEILSSACRRCLRIWGGVRSGRQWLCM